MMVAPGGVDMRTGRYAYSQTDLSIGGEAAPTGLRPPRAVPLAGFLFLRLRTK